MVSRQQAKRAQRQAWRKIKEEESESSNFIDRNLGRVVSPSGQGFWESGMPSYGTAEGAASWTTVQPLAQKRQANFSNALISAPLKAAGWTAGTATGLAAMGTGAAGRAAGRAAARGARQGALSAKQRIQGRWGPMYGPAMPAQQPAPPLALSPGRQPLAIPQTTTQNARVMGGATGFPVSSTGAVGAREYLGTAGPERSAREQERDLFGYRDTREGLGGVIDTTATEVVGTPGPSGSEIWAARQEQGKRDAGREAIRRVGSRTSGRRQKDSINDTTDVTLAKGPVGPFGMSDAGMPPAESYFKARNTGYGTGRR